MNNDILIHLRKFRRKMGNERDPCKSENRVVEMHDYIPERHFIEVQRFNQRWIWILLIGASGTAVCLFGYGIIKQLVFGQPWGDRPMSDLALAIVGPGIMLFVIGMTYLFYAMKLITEVRSDGLFVRFFPLSQRIIPYETITSCVSRTYSPIKEYGGWGIRWGRSGRAYNVSGNQGVQLELSDKNPLLIGSQRPEELAGAINAKRHSRHSV
jgi:hypothetical protein